MLKHLTISVFVGALLVSCSPADNSKQDRKKPEISKTQIATQSQDLNDWFAARTAEDLARSPMLQTYLGHKTAQGKLDDVSQAALDEQYEIGQQNIADMHKLFAPDKLDRQGKISYRLFEYNGGVAKTDHPFVGHQYVFNHMSGPHSEFPTFMVNFHKVETIADAQGYIARLGAAKRYFAQYQTRAEAQVENGIVLPKFVYGKLIAASENIIAGEPFSDGHDSPLYADIKAKINKLDAPQADKHALLVQAGQALATSLGPAYENLITMFEAHEKIATDDDGAWKHPDGAAYYNSRLRTYTTTDLSAEEIHEIGLKEVARIQGEMRQIMQQVKFEGSLQEFYSFLRTDARFTFSNDDAGRAQYMAGATAVIDDMKGRLDDLFITKPKADMIVKRVEPFREATAFFAFYNLPSQDGSRPGTYFINLKDVRDQPIYLMQALAYHEGIPGHHMQLAIAMELENIPEFRKRGLHTAYIEGWALYAESVPAELGLYTDPYSDFGRLSMEIFRAARLVVDTGLHAKKWTREQAVQYMLENIPNTESSIRGEIDRYIVWPGQATAYKIGMIKIGDLKKSAQMELGDKFDIREFHDVVLANGSVPLSILEELVAEWVASEK